jgi:hypothetical protein
MAADARCCPQALRQVGGRCAGNLSRGERRGCAVAARYRMDANEGHEAQIFIKGNAVSHVSTYRGVISIETLDH